MTRISRCIVSLGSLTGISEEIREQLVDAASHTGKAYAAVRRSREPDADSDTSHR